MANAGVHRAYLRPHMGKRPNLRVETGCYVIRILFEGKRAVGVEMLQNGQKKTLHARHEVLLAAVLCRPAIADAVRRRQCECAKAWEFLWYTTCPALVRICRIIRISCSNIARKVLICSAFPPLAACVCCVN
jgi:hypothetical protein